ADALRAAMDRIIAGAPLADPDYAEIVDRETLEPVETATDRAVAVLAVRVGETRLIDNHPFAEEFPEHQT
ncbi:MAG: pantoate--beta-alanine ligase, partial [Candidatus Brocadiia bacterium]